MKKVLITAASIAVLTTGVAAHADHNYVGLGLGWVAAKATSTNNNHRSADTDPYRKKLKTSDTSSFSGSILLGHSFGDVNSSWFVEGSLRKDSADAKNNYVYSPETVGVAYPIDVSVSLKRKYSLSFGLGYSQNIVRDISAYAKLSALLSKFNLSTRAVPRIDNIATVSASKRRYCLGTEITVGVSKQFQDFSLSLDYSFAFYQKIKASGKTHSVLVATDVYQTTKIAPMYHTVMLGITKSF